MNRGRVQILITPARATSQMPWWVVEWGAWRTGLIKSSQHVKCNFGGFFRSSVLWLGVQQCYAALQHPLHQNIAREG